MVWLWTLLPIALCFLLGSIPFAFLAGQIHGKDLRKEGSGNVGATNALRVLGTKTGILVLILDALKGAATVILGASIAANGICSVQWFPMLCGLAAVMGHVFSPFMGFRGGKGVATSAGVFLALSPIALGISFAIFAGVVAITRFVSLGSTFSALALPFLVFWQQGMHPTLILALGLASLILIRHRTNWSRLLNGQESKISFTRNGTTAATKSEDALDEMHLSQEESNA